MEIYRYISSAVRPSVKVFYEPDMSGISGIQYNTVQTGGEDTETCWKEMLSDNNCDYISYDGVVTLEQITPRTETNTQLHSLSPLTRPL